MSNLSTNELRQTAEASGRRKSGQRQSAATGNTSHTLTDHPDESAGKLIPTSFERAQAAEPEARAAEERARAAEERARAAEQERERVLAELARIRTEMLDRSSED